MYVCLPVCLLWSFSLGADGARKTKFRRCNLHHEITTYFLFHTMTHQIQKSFLLAEKKIAGIFLHQLNFLYAIDEIIEKRFLRRIYAGSQINKNMRTLPSTTSLF